MGIFVRSISSNENYENYGWSQGEFANIQNLAALRSDGTVVSWGRLTAYSLPNDNSGFPISGIVKLYSHMYGYAGLKYDGSVVTWGRPYFDVEMPNDLGDVKKIYSTREAFAALKHDGSVVTWGGMAIGENFGEDSSSVSSSLNSGVTDIVSTHGAFAALKNDGSVVTWGLTRDGGDSSAVSDQLSSGVNKIYSTNYSFAALKNDGSVVTWGFDTKAGQIDYLWGPWNSNGENGNSNVLESGVSKVCTMSDGYFAAIKTDGSVVVWGWGAPGVWLETEDPDVIRFIDISDQLSSGVVNIFSTNTAAAALKSDGSVVTWGEKIYGGDSSSVISQISSDVISISTTGYAFAALKSDGSVITWGENERGGDSSLVSDDLSSGVQKIYGGGDTFAALKDDGSVISWGEYEPQSHLGSVTTSWESVKDQLSNGVVDVVHNGQSDAWAALKSDGSVVTWGRNDYGGDSTKVMGPDWTLNGTKSEDQLSYGIAALNNVFTDEIITLYLIKPSSTNIVEGNTLNTTVQTTNIPSGTNIYWSLSGTGINSSDLISGDLEGVSKLSDDGSFSFSQTFLADGNNEGKETLEIKLFSDASRSAQLGLTKFIQINDNNTPPTIYGPTGSTDTNSTITIKENTTSVYTFNSDEIVTWSKFGGDDQQQFNIDSNSGALRFWFAPDYEEAIDSNQDNAYSVTIRATDSVGNTTDQTINIFVEDVAEIDPKISQPSETKDTSNTIINKENTIFVNTSNADTSESTLTSSTATLSDLEAYNYIASYGDLINAFGTDIEAAKSHYTNYGKSEGRSLTSFSATDYLSKYSDLSATFGDDKTSALKHYIQYGHKEGRTDSSTGSNLTDFEALNYIASYGDLINAFGTDLTSAKSHYTNNGKSEGRALDDFDEWGYLASNTDLMNAFGNDTTEAVKHYIFLGIKEGRKTDGFNAESYLNNYAVLKSAFGNDHTLAKKHYVENGFNEGRVF